MDDIRGRFGIFCRHYGNSCQVRHQKDGFVQFLKLRDPKTVPSKFVRYLKQQVSQGPALGG